MKLLFKKRNEPYIYSQYYLRIQNQWAIRMSRLTARMSKIKLTLLLVLFVALTVGYLIYNICRTVSLQDTSVTNATVISKVKTIKKIIE